jgi:hypothetical protein
MRKVICAKCGAEMTDRGMDRVFVSKWLPYCESCADKFKDKQELTVNLIHHLYGQASPFIVSQ